MKGVVGIAAAMLALTVGSVTVASANESSGQAFPAKAKKKKAKKCKANWVFKKGKCRRRKTPPPAPVTPVATSAVRANLAVDGPAALSLVITDPQGRRADGSVDEIPDTTFTTSGGPGSYTETFTDHLVYQVTTYAGPFTREFTYTTCFNGSGGGTSHVDFVWVAAGGLVNHASWTITPSAPPGDPEVTGCATYLN